MKNRINKHQSILAVYSGLNNDIDNISVLEEINTIKKNIDSIDNIDVVIQELRNSVSYKTSPVKNVFDRMTNSILESLNIKENISA